MLHSHFGLAPRGDNLYTRRFLEIMSSGVIPIVLADGWVPPFDEIIDWPSASVFIPERRARDIADGVWDASFLLHRIDGSQMQRRR